MVEHAAVNRDVEGSSPSSGAILLSRWRTTTVSSGRALKRRKNTQVCSETCSKRRMDEQKSHSPQNIRVLLLHCSLSKNFGDTELKGVYENEILAL
jgi:hypothetical protein